MITIRTAADKEVTLNLDYVVALVQVSSLDSGVSRWEIVVAHYSAQEEVRLLVDESCREEIEDAFFHKIGEWNRPSGCDKEDYE